MLKSDEIFSRFGSIKNCSNEDIRSSDAKINACKWKTDKSRLNHFGYRDLKCLKFFPHKTRFSAFESYIFMLFTVEWRKRGGQYRITLTIYYLTTAAVHWRHQTHSKNNEAQNSSLQPEIWEFLKWKAGMYSIDTYAFSIIRQVIWRFYARKVIPYLQGKINSTFGPIILDNCRKSLIPHSKPTSKIHPLIKYEITFLPLSDSYGVRCQCSYIYNCREERNKRINFLLDNDALKSGLRTLTTWGSGKFLSLFHNWFRHQFRKIRYSSEGSATSVGMFRLLLRYSGRNGSYGH